MLFMAEEQLRLREVQGVRAGDIHRVNSVALRHVIKRGEEMLNEVIVGKTLRLLKAAGIDCGKFQFAGFVGGVDELARDPVRSNDCETYHKRLRTPLRGTFSHCSTSS